MIEVRTATDAELPVCLEIRREVFIYEQSVPEADEIDGLDPECRHVIARVDGEAAGTARLRVVGEQAKIERVAVRGRFRGRDLGRALMAAVEALARADGHPDVRLGAQVAVIRFYEKLGYQVEGPEFMDAGIPHRMMRKAL